jgi:transcriptional regulator with XRE-family HTH domain
MGATAIASKVTQLSERAHLTQEDVGRIVGTSGRTVGRWARGDVNPQPTARERLLELAYVAEQLVEVLGLSPDDANIWIFSPNRLLDGDKPSERIHTGDYRSVLALIDALADGIVA